MLKGEHGIIKKGLVMNIEVNLENAVSLFSYADKKIICGILSELDLSEDKSNITINLTDVSNNVGFSRSMTMNCIKTLCCLGVITTQNRSPMGTLIVVCNAAACRRIYELCS